MIRIGINGFGRIGRLVFRAAWQRDDVVIQRINDPASDAVTLAHLLNFDSIHGRWHHQAEPGEGGFWVGDQQVLVTQNSELDETNWSDCDLVIEASGTWRSATLLQPLLDQGVQRVVVTAPIKEPEVLNVVMGVNDHLYDPEKYPIVTAASCTTNSLAPVVKVIHESLGIKHGSITTIHALTNTQTILDAPHKDLRRARACGSSLIPTSTGSATAIIEIFPELKGRLNGHAVRVPLASPSLVDVVFEVETPTDRDRVNELLKTAAAGELKGILGFEERPLVSVDYIGEICSGVVDGLSTMVINETQVKIYVWYDNEWCYANRTIELAVLVGASL